MCLHLPEVSWIELWRVDEDGAECHSYAEFAEDEEHGGESLSNLTVSCRVKYR